MTPVAEESYSSLKAKLEAVCAEMEAARSREFEAVLVSLRKTISDYGITERDIFGRQKLDGGRDSRFGRVAAKYRNPETDETWTGRGRPPRWIAGKCYAEFLIQPDA
jgi:DNA-binding protein H-NS